MTIQNPTLIHNFVLPAAADWATQTNCSMADNTTLSRMGQSCRTQTKTGTEIHYCTGATDWIAAPGTDITGTTHVRFRFYIHPGVSGSATDWRTIKYFGIYLYSSTNASTYGYYTIYTCTSDTAEQTIQGPGWYVVDRPLNSAASRTLVQSTIRKITLSLETRAITGVTANEATPSITLESIEAWSDTAKPAVMFRLDDAYEPYQSAALNYLRQYGFVGTVGYGIGREMTEAQVIAYNAQGHLFVNHMSKTVHDLYDDGTPPIIYPGFTTREFLADFQLNAAYMESIGLSRGARILMLPGGAWSEELRSVMSDEVLSVWRAHNLANEQMLDSQLSPRILSGTLARFVGDGRTPTCADEDKVFDNTGDTTTFTVKGLKNCVDQMLEANGGGGLGAYYAPYWHQAGLVQTGGVIDPACGFAQFVRYCRTLVDAGTIRVITPETLLQERIEGGPPIHGQINETAGIKESITGV